MHVFCCGVHVLLQCAYVGINPAVHARLLATLALCCAAYESVSILRRCAESLEEDHLCPPPPELCWQNASVHQLTPHFLPGLWVKWKLLTLHRVCAARVTI